jgi:hypothetical protein
LANGRDPFVCKDVALAMAANPKPAYIRSLVPMLEWRESREEARRALVAIGPEALEAMTTALQDPATPLHLRRHLPRTISRFQPQRAAGILLAHLPEERDSVVTYKILRAVGRLRTNHPHIQLDMRLLDLAIEENLRAAFESLDCRISLGNIGEKNPRMKTHAQLLLHELLLSEHHNALERLFRLLQLKYQREDFSRIYRGLQSPNPRTRDSSRELLQHALDPPERDVVLGLIDEIPEEAKLEFGARYRAEDAGSRDPGSVLQGLILRGSDTVRAIAAYHGRELGLQEVEAALGS